jgi:hypothetical protein
LHPRTREAVDKEQAGVVPEIFAFFPVIPIFLETFDADADGLLYLGYTSMDATGMDMEILALQTV